MSRPDLAKHRPARAKEFLNEADDSPKQGHFAMSVNRSYYSMFTSARSLLALKDLDSSKHSGVISLFNQHIVDPGLLPAELGKFLRAAKEIRESADYGDFVKITQEDAEIQLDSAKRFLGEAEVVLRTMTESSRD